MTTVLVTGAAGYLGSRLTEVLAGRGAQVRALVRKRVGFLAVEQIEGDLLDHAAIPSLEDVDSVVHLAGANEVVTAAEPARALAETVAAAERISETAAAAGVGRVVYASTVHVYGARLVPGAVVDEEVVPEPTSVYATARLACEHLVRLGGNAVVYRLTNCVGAPVSAEVDRWSLVASDLARQAATSGVMRLRSDGTQWRDFVALSDVCELLAATALGEGPPAATYNVAWGRCQTVRDLASQVAGAFVAEGVAAPRLVAPDPVAEPAPPYTVSARRLAATGWSPRTPVDVALSELVRFCLTHRGRW